MPARVFAPSAKRSHSAARLRSRGRNGAPRDAVGADGGHEVDDLAGMPRRGRGRLRLRAGAGRGGGEGGGVLEDFAAGGHWDSCGSPLGE